MSSGQGMTTCAPVPDRTRVYDRAVPWTEESIVTERLRLRPADEADKPVLVELLTDPEVRRYLGGPVDDETVEQFRGSVVGERPDSFVVEHREDGVAVGVVTLGRDREREDLEVSYQFVPSVWGQGVAFEAVEAVLAWAWPRNPDASIIAVTQTANERSLRLLDRLGFVAEREFEEFDAPQTLLRLRRPT